MPSRGPSNRNRPARTRDEVLQQHLTRLWRKVAARRDELIAKEQAKADAEKAGDDVVDADFEEIDEDDDKKKSA